MNNNTTNKNKSNDSLLWMFVCLLGTCIKWYVVNILLFFKKLSVCGLRGAKFSIGTFIVCCIISFLTYASKQALQVDARTLFTLLLPFIFPPFAHLLVFKTRNKLNEQFEQYYSLMGFKEDEEKGLQYPYAVRCQETKKEIILSFKANNNRMEQFKKAIDVLEEITNLEYKDIRKNEKNRSLVEVIFYNPDFEVDRLDIENVSVDSTGAIPINADFIWKPWQDPHMLINGGTGGGKTFFIFYLVKCFLEQKASIKILDPKHSDLTRLTKYLGKKNVAYKHDEIAEIMKETVKEMYDRAEEMGKVEDMPLGSDYRDYGYKPVFIIFDEYMAFMRGGVDEKVKKETQKYVLDIVAMGRQLGYEIVVGMQKGSTKGIDGDVRTQFHFRCVLGKMDSEGYKMAFGENYKLKKTLNGKGSGFIQIEGQSEEPEEFYTPFIDKGYDLLGEIEKIVNANKSELDVAREQKEEKEEKSKTIKLSDIKNVKLSKEG
jgi:hypothetical protein